MIAPIEDKRHALMTLDGFVVSIQTFQTMAGCHAEWWVSSIRDSAVLVVGHYTSPVYGEGAVEALRKAESLTPFVVELVAKTWDGFSIIDTQPKETEDKVLHAKLHMEGHKESFYEDELVLRSARFNFLAQFFGCSNSSQIVAEFEGVNVRTIHERVQRHRKSVLADLAERI